MQHLLFVNEAGVLLLEHRVQLLYQGQFSSQFLLFSFHIVSFLLEAFGFGTHLQVVLKFDFGLVHEHLYVILLLLLFDPHIIIALRSRLLSRVYTDIRIRRDLLDVFL